MASSSSPPLSSLIQPQPCCSSATLSELGYLQKPVPKHPLISPMSSLVHSYGCSSPFYDAHADYSEAGESIEQGFAGGDDPLLTSSWEALDKLVSASMTASASTAATEQVSDLPSIHALQNAMSDPSSFVDMDQKPLSALYGCLYQQAAAWARADHADVSANNPASNLASLISADPGFVERAAKFSSYSQQVNNSAAFNYSHLHNKKISHLWNPAGKLLSDVDGPPSELGKLMNYSGASVGDHITQLASYNAATLQPDGTKRNNAGGSPMIADINIKNVDKHDVSPQASTISLTGSKKKREGPIKDDEVDAKQVRKRAKVGSEQEDIQDASNKVGNISPDHSKNNSRAQKSSGAGSEKIKQRLVGGSNSGESEQKSEVCNNSKTPSPSPSPSLSVKLDYIHVRARRGQATDSHSLAERVRREKISERMKYLQDLVPGCTKVTGKAMMLDEIINYVQSLQRQVEFLSMKLAAVHPSKLEFNFESLFGKEMIERPTLQSNRGAPIPNSLLEATSLLHRNSAVFLQENPQGLQNNMSLIEAMNLNPDAAAMLQSSLGPESSLRQPFGMLAAAGSADNFGDCVSQICNAWVDDDLQNIVPSLPGFMPPSFTVHPGLQG